MMTEKEMRKAEKKCNRCKLINPGLCLLLRLISIGMAEPPCVLNKKRKHQKRIATLSKLFHVE